MNTILSLLALMAVSVLGLKYVFLGRRYVLESPINSKEKIVVSSRQRLVLFLLAAAILQAGTFSAVLLLVWIFLFLKTLLKYSTRFSASPLFAFYGFYLIWLLISLVLTPVPDFGFRVFAKFLFPFLIVAVTSSLVIDNNFFIKALKIAFKSAIIVNVFFLVSQQNGVLYSLYNSVFWFGPAVIDSNPFAIAISIILFKLTANKNYLYCIALFLLVPAIESVRTGFVGIGVCLIAMSFFKYKLKALPIFVFILATVVGSVLFIPSIRDKMFRGAFKSASEVVNSTDKISFDNIETSGRSFAWEWALNEYYKGHEIMGSGVGQLQARLYSTNNPLGGLQVIHNDYIQILCDTGRVGLGLYILVVVSFVIHSFIIYNDKKNNLAARYSAFIAGTSILGIMACAFTDNVINYSLVTLSYPYVFFGFALALKKLKLPSVL